jgi:hypothetical protein
MKKTTPSPFANQDLDLPSEEKESEALHLETDKEKLIPFVEPSLKGHRWVQRGPFLVCRSCKLEHAAYIGTGVLFMGVDKEGKPILKKVEVRDKP